MPVPSEIFNEAVTDLTTDQVVLTIITLHHDEWDSDIHMVDNVTDITSNGTLYKAYGFSFVGSSDNTGGDPVARLEVEDIDKILNANFRSVTSEVDITISVILADTPDIVELGPYTFSVVKVTTSGPVLTLSLKKQTVLRNALTGFNMDVNYFPGLFL